MARSLSPRDAVIERFLPLADGLAWRFHARFRDLLEADDLIQVARLALVQASGRLRQQSSAPAYLKCCIVGALHHHLRDRALLVRLPARARDAAPWRHLSLDEPLASADGDTSDDTCRLQALAAPAPPSPDLLDAAASCRVEALLAGLPADQAEAIQLTVLDGLSLRQAARQLGTSSMTVSRRRRSGLQQLAPLLQESRQQGQPRATAPQHLYAAA